LTQETYLRAMRSATGLLPTLTALVAALVLLSSEVAGSPGRGRLRSSRVDAPLMLVDEVLAVAGFYHAPSTSAEAYVHRRASDQGDC
jgi:hypothetical protein